MARLVSILLTFRLATALGGDAGLAALDADNGLRDARLGAPLDGFSGLELVDRDEAARTATYVRPGDDVRLAGTAFDAIVYAFHGDRLYAIELTAENGAEVRALRRALGRRYGPGEPGAEPGERLWSAERIELRLEVDPDAPRARARFTSRVAGIAVEGEAPGPVSLAPAR